MYPKFATTLPPRDQLLFDVGYTYALLQRTKQVLGEVAACGDYPVEVGEMIEEIEEFQTNRLLLRNEIYANAEAVLAVDRRLAALNKILAAADASNSGKLWDAIAEARKICP